MGRHSLLPECASVVLKLSRTRDMMDMLTQLGASVQQDGVVPQQDPEPTSIPAMEEPPVESSVSGGDTTPLWDP